MCTSGEQCTLSIGGAVSVGGGGPPLEAGNAERGHVPCSGNFVPERGTGTTSQNGMERRSDAAGTCASALGRPPLPLPARRLPPPSSAAAQLRARPWGAGRNRAVVVLLATAQREARLALAHGLLNASTLRLSGSASPARPRPPWSPTRTRRSVLLRGPES